MSTNSSERKGKVKSTPQMSKVQSQDSAAMVLREKNFTTSKSSWIRNEFVRGTEKIAKLGDKLRGTTLRWYGHVKRREEGYVEKRMIEMAIPGKRKRVRPKIR